ncbi:GMC family oxidoreductase [Streptomyces violaceusniger]|uniref:GMC oxidoreductase n=1 Tax=Streptomyces violaceusniger TaxID=68280 RepID=A0A4D4LDV1_STRVO|nr:GMC oxidoreductase [Streptomyces violaceusniger]
MMSDYDYIVVGAGSAGAVVAARLTEAPDVRVLLLEAGKDDAAEQIHDPTAWFTLIGGEHDWGYTTVPQPGLAGHPQAAVRGKVLGGSSSINVMTYVRGHLGTFDAWAADGCTGWDAASVLEAFRALEHTEGSDPRFRGTGGPLRLSRAGTPNPLSTAFLDAAKELGHPYNDDFNGAESDGAGRHEWTIHEGRRQSTAVAYLDPAMDRPNLTVRTEARAHRLLFEGTRCVGVEYAGSGGAARRVRAAREVVVCAGSVDSPKLLMLSGIGPSGHLRDVGVPVLVDAPEVGANLQDHPLVGLVHEAGTPLPPPPPTTAEAALFTRTDPGLPGPDLEVFLFHIPFHPRLLPFPPNSFTLTAAAMRPHSRGTVRLSGADPEDRPLIDPGYLSDERDLATLVQGVELARSLAATDAFQAWQPRELLPGPGVSGRDGLADFVRENAGTYFHHVGTCRMGGDERSVVDPRLRVRGVEGLRIADGSIMPSIVSANTNAACVMIGEMAAELIRADA